jgi:hypothetical protein
MKAIYGQLGGLKTTGSTFRQRRLDLAEVREYLKQHPNASSSDVVLCCNMGRSQALRLMKAACGEADA